MLEKLKSESGSRTLEGLKVRCKHSQFIDVYYSMRESQGVLNLLLAACAIWRFVAIRCPISLDSGPDFFHFNSLTLRDLTDSEQQSATV